jgi:outer membrane lipoprotein-sorting protein
MRRSTHWAAICTVLLGFGVTAIADEALDKAVKELDESFAKVKSYTATSKTTSEWELQPGQPQKTEMAATIEWTRKGEKALMRNESKTETAQTQNGETTKTTTNSLLVCDGEFCYSLTEQDGQKTVIKSPAWSAKDSQPKAFFDQWQSYGSIKLLPDEKVGGEDCYVFELKMKPMEGAPPAGRTVVYYRKDNGISVQSEGFDAEGKLNSSSITTDLKVNVDISADRFKFEIPAGAQVMDQTASQEQPEQEAPKGENKEEKEQKEKKGIKLPKLPKRP